MTKKSKTPSRKRQKIVEVVEEKDQEDEDVDITGDAEAPQADDDEGAGSSNKERKRRSDVGKPRMKIKSLKMKNDKRFVLVGKGWKELDPKKVIVPSLFE